MYNYRDSRSNIIKILKSKTKIEEKNRIPSDQEFTYANSITTWVGAIFIDIADSSELFKNRDEKLVRLMRAFISEVITIFQDKEQFNQIGIRGDCVYAIYSADKKDDLYEIFNIAVMLNTFLKMFNKIIVDYGYNQINAGIGLGCDKELIVKAGKTGTGINDKIWIGNAVVDASNLSSIAGRNGYNRIAMNQCFYNNIIEKLKKADLNYDEWISRTFNTEVGNFYHCDIIEVEFNNWIDGGFKG